MINILYSSTGVVKYSHDSSYGYRVITEIDEDIVKYYRKLIPKYIWHRPQKYGSHITVVRRETPTGEGLLNWGRHDGEEVVFKYENTVYYNDRYYWLNCFSNPLENIRLELGLSIEERYTTPPILFNKTFHISLANYK